MELMFLKKPEKKPIKSKRLIIYLAQLVTFDHSEGERYFSKFIDAKNYIVDYGRRYIRTQVKSRKKEEYHFYLYQLQVRKIYVDSEKKQKIVFEMELQEIYEEEYED